MLGRSREPRPQQVRQHHLLGKKPVVPGRIKIDEGDRLVDHGEQAITPRR
jgi:hypothetical protein